MKPQAVLVARSHPTFCLRVKDIRGVISEEVMGGIATRTVVALMAHEQIARVYSGRKEKGYPMGQINLAVAMPNGKPAVSTVIPVADPWPAVVRAANLDLLPESGNLLFCQRDNRFTLDWHRSLLQDFGVGLGWCVNTCRDNPAVYHPDICFEAGNF